MSDEINNEIYRDEHFLITTDDIFEAEYEVAGKIVKVHIEPHIPDDFEGQQQWCATYEDGSKKIVEQIMGIGWVEENEEPTEDARLIGRQIENRYPPLTEDSFPTINDDDLPPPPNIEGYVPRRDDPPMPADYDDGLDF